MELEDHGISGWTIRLTNEEYSRYLRESAIDDEAVMTELDHLREQLAAANGLVTTLTRANLMTYNTTSSSTAAPETLTDIPTAATALNTDHAGNSIWDQIVQQKD